MNSVAYISKDGVIRCYGSTLVKFATDIKKYILPLIDTTVECCFNDIHFTVHKSATEDEIIQMWLQELGINLS